MTILGCIVEPDRAILWSDTEIYSDDGSVSGENTKLAINPMGFAVAGAGSMALVHAAARSAMAAASIDKLEKRLPAELRIHAGKLAPALIRRNITWCSGQVIIAAGFSPAAGRMVGWRFEGPGFFEPGLLSRVLVPSDPTLEVDIRQASALHDIVATARRQIEIIRQRLPLATGGSLIVVEMTESTICARRIPDFDLRPPAAPREAASLQCDLTAKQ